MACRTWWFQTGKPDAPGGKKVNETRFWMTVNTSFSKAPGQDNELTAVGAETRCLLLGHHGK